VSVLRIQFAANQAAARHGQRRVHFQIEDQRDR
jgi:hypothetical protein